MNDLLRAGLAVATGFVVAALLVPPLLRLARGLGALSGGTAERWNPRATPVLGGVAIFGGSALAGLVSLSLLGEAALRDYLFPVQTGDLFLGTGPALLMAGTLIFLLGLLDDIYPLSPAAKLAGQVAAAGVLLLAGIMLRLTGIYALDATLSVLWFVGITNAMNLLDNMDGAAAGVAGIVALYLGALLIMDGNLVTALLAFGVAGGVGGFLVFNYPPARIFMGDSGALFLGLFLAGLALAPTPGLSRGLFAVLAVPVLVLAVPILDTTLVTVTRLWEGRAVSQGGRDHTSHRLAGLGLSEERVVWLLWGLAAAGGGVAFLFRTAERGMAYLLGGGLLVTFALLAAFLARGGGGGSAESASVDVSAAPWTRRLTDWHARWPFLALFLDVGVVTLAYWAAYVLRWEGQALTAELAYFQRSLPIVLAAKITAFAWAGVYRQRFRQVGFHEAGVFLRANALGTLIMAVLLLLLARGGFSRGVLFIDFMVCSAFTLGARVFFRYMEGASRRWDRAGKEALVWVTARDAEWALPYLEQQRGSSGLRPVAVAHPGFPPLLGALRGLPAYGGPEALARGLTASGAHWIVVVEPEVEPASVPDGVAVMHLRPSLVSAEQILSG
ncbi:MAG: hypothetical protein WEA09_04300 [Gemmatimonadota bacterium]